MLSHKTLLLDKNYQPVSFLNFKRMVKLLCLEKVDVVSTWNVPFVAGARLPAVLRLKSFVRKRLRASKVTRRGIFKRDMFLCQYTLREYPISLLTIDHILPRSRGGLTSWENCVTACLEVNLIKGNRLPNEVHPDEIRHLGITKLELDRRPYIPEHFIKIEYAHLEPKHEDWKLYLG